MIRLYENSDLAHISTWWEEREWSDTPSNLPRLGVVVYGDDGDKAVAWIYADMSCGVGWIGWVVTNPANSLADTIYIDELFQGCENVARSQGINTLLFSSVKESMTRLLEKQGYVRGDTAQHLIKKL